MLRRKVFLIIICTLLGGFIRAGESAAPITPALYVHYEADAHARAAVVLTIAPDWHIYHETLGTEDGIGKPTELTLAGGGYTWSKPTYPEPEKYLQPGLGANGQDTWVYAHSGQVIIHFESIGPTPNEEIEPLSATIDALLCGGDGTCIPFRRTITGAQEDNDALFVSSGPSAPEAGPSTPGRNASDILTTNTSPLDSAKSPKGNATQATSTYPDTTTSQQTIPSQPLSPKNLSGQDETTQRTELDWMANWPALPAAATPQSSALMAFLLAMLAGMLLNIMPCVLPMISIRLMQMVKIAEHDRATIFRHGLAFGAGIIAVFLILGGLAAFAGLGWGQQFQHEWFLVVMILVVFLFALSLFDVFEISLPQSVGNLDGRRSGAGYGDAFWKGMLATILATPCSGPFLGSTLVWAMRQPAAIILGIFLSMGVGMALPHIVLNAFPTLIKKIPKPGAWMLTFRHLMGFVLLGMAIYLMRAIRSEQMYPLVTLLCFAGLAAWIFGHFHTPVRPARQRWLGVLAAMIILVAGGWSTFSANGWLNTARIQTSPLSWTPLTPVSFASAEKSGSPMLILFTADWCSNCKYNKRFVYENDEIVRLLRQKKVRLLKADITHQSPQTEKLQSLMAQLGGQAIPFAVIISPKAPNTITRLYDLLTVEDVRRPLSQLP